MKVMTMFARRFSLSAALLAPAFLLAAPAAAAVLEIGAASGVFGNAEVNPGQGGDLQGLGSSSINWGESAENTFNSAYTFEGRDVSADEGSFVLGTFEHRNGYNWRRSADLQSVDLSIDMAGTFAGQDFSLERTLSLVHDETYNEAAACGQGGGNPCGDTVDGLAFDPFELAVESGDLLYTLSIDGFFDSPTGEDVGDFFTAERDTNLAYLVGRISVETLTEQEPEEPPPVPEPPPAPVPLPAAGWLLVGALGAVSALRRRR
jgi:hypothetical protein